MSKPKIADLLYENSDGAKGLTSHAWPGGYPIVYYCANGDMLCPKCATKQLLDGDEESESYPTMWRSGTKALQSPVLSAA